jgi:hypothetical protein
MNLIVGAMYKVRRDHPYHANKTGRFEFLGGPESDVIVLSDLEDKHTLFAVGLHDLVED